MGVMGWLFSKEFLRLKVVSYLEGVISSETGRLGKMVINSVERMDEIDHMYDDMQDRVFEIDKNRKNNLVGQIFLFFFSQIFQGVLWRERRGNRPGRVWKDDQKHHEQVHAGEGYQKQNFEVFDPKVTREIPLVKVIRLWNGPSFRGYKPIQVLFGVKD